MEEKMKIKKCNKKCIYSYGVGCILAGCRRNPLYTKDKVIKAKCLDFFRLPHECRKRDDVVIKKNIKNVSTKNLEGTIVNVRDGKYCYQVEFFKRLWLSKKEVQLLRRNS